MLEPAAIDYGTGHTNHQLRVWLLAHLPDAATGKERAEAADGRRVDVIACPAGMSLLSAYLPTETAVAVFDTLDRIARTHAGDARSTDQRRADAFTDLLHHTTTVQTSVAIVLPATGHGATINTTPIPWQVALQLATAAPAVWSTWLTDPTGRIIHTTPGRYRIPDPLARTVRARDLTRRFPGCTVPAGRCDLDHTLAFPTGPPDFHNLHALCRRHHRIKHQTGWTVAHTGDNTLEWTSPAGNTYRTTPPTWLPKTA